MAAFRHFKGVIFQPAATLEFKLSDTKEADGQELLYSTHVSLDRTQMEIDGRLANLSPGMAVTVEIRTGSRRVIEYVMSPLLRYK